MYILILTFLDGRPRELHGTKLSALFSLFVSLKLLLGFLVVNNVTIIQFASFLVANNVTIIEFASLLVANNVTIIQLTSLRHKMKFFIHAINKAE